MSSKEIMVGGKPLSSLRVVDLKEELEKRGLSKSGSKKDLADRLKKTLILEDQRNAQSTADDEQLPNLSTRAQLAETNPFLRDYFESQAELYHSQKVVKKLYEGMAHTPQEEEQPAAAAPAPAAAPAVAPPPTQEPKEPSPVPEVPPPQPEPPINKEKPKPVEVTPPPPVVEVVQAVVAPIVVVEPPAPAVPETPAELPVVVSEPTPEPSPAPSPPPAEPEPVVVQEAPVVAEKEEAPEVPKAEAVTKEVTPEVPAEPVAPEKRAPSPVKEETKKKEEVLVMGKKSKAPEPVVEETPVPETLKKEEEEPVVKAPVVPETKKEKPVVKAAVPETKEVPKAQEAEPIIVEAPVPETKEEPEQMEVEDSRKEEEERPRPPPDEPEAKGKDLGKKRKKEEPEESSSGEEEESRDEEEDDEEPPPKSKPPAVQKRSSPPRPAEEVLDYEDEESNDKKELEDSKNWKRRPISRPSPPPPPPETNNKVINNKKPRSVSPDEGRKAESKQRSSSASSSPSSSEGSTASSAENPTAAVEKSTKPVQLSRTGRMDVDEALDYGEEESDIKRDDFIWTRRILRLKNRCSIVETVEKKWNREDRKPVLVTSKVLEAFFPDVKPLPESEVRLEERIPKKEEPKEEQAEEKTEKEASESMDAGSADVDGTLPNIKRKISIIPFQEAVKELTPPRNPATNILVITNLTRPFTLTQLKELLQRTGTIEDIWVDKIKSKCLAKFERQAEAEETRSALHGISWPPSNPKALIVDFTSEAEFENVAKEKEEPKVKVEKPKEANKALPVREWDLGKRSRSRSPGRTKRAGSAERKRARKSISPHGRRSPHHDKKSRDHDIKEETQVKALDELFRKTTTTPCLYWLPLTPEQISEKEELRRKRMVEREHRIAEMEKLRPGPR